MFASVAIAVAGACTVFNGLVADPVDAGDAGGSDAGAPDVGPVDPCNANAPKESTGEPGNDDATSIVMAVTKIAFTRDPGDLVGFDLDGVCPCVQAQETLCGDAGQCDGDAGVDNAVGAMVKIAAALAGKDYDIEEKINSRIARGGSLLVVLENYNGTSEDPRVRVSFYPTLERDGGSAGVWIRDRAFFDGDTSLQFALGSVRDGGLVAVLQKELTLHPRLKTTFGRGTLSGSIEQARQGGELMLAGWIHRDHLVELIGGFAATEDNAVPQCATPLWKGVRESLCASADMLFTGPERDTATACTAFSVGLALTVVPASLGGPVDDAPKLDAATCSAAEIQCP